MASSRRLSEVETTSGDNLPNRTENARKRSSVNPLTGRIQEWRGHRQMLPARTAAAALAGATARLAISKAVMSVLSGDGIRDADRQGRFFAVPFRRLSAVSRRPRAISLDRQKGMETILSCLDALPTRCRTPPFLLRFPLSLPPRNSIKKPPRPCRRHIWFTGWDQRDAQKIAWDRPVLSRSRSLCSRESAPCWTMPAGRGGFSLRCTRESNFVLHAVDRNAHRRVDRIQSARTTEQSFSPRARCERTDTCTGRSRLRATARI